MSESREEQLRAAVHAYIDSVPTPRAEALVRRAAPTRDAAWSRPRRWVAGAAVALAVGLPTAAAAAHLAPAPWDPLQGLNPDSKTVSPARQLPRLPAGSETIGDGSVSLVVLPGTQDGRSCVSLTAHGDAGADSMTECGGGDGETTASNVLGVGLVYSPDPGATRVHVASGAAGYDRVLRAGYALVPHLSAGSVVVRTYDAKGHVIGTHEESVPAETKR